MIKEEIEIIETLGLFFEKLGITRMSGKILGYLLVKEPEPISFMELVEKLDASKSAISNNIKTLLHFSMIEEKTKPGDRKTYYNFQKLFWVSLMQQRVSQVGEFAAIFGKVDKINRKNGRQTPTSITDGYEFYTWLKIEMDSLIQKWEQKKNRRGNEKQEK